MDKKLDLTLYLVLDPTLCGGIDGMVKTAKIAVQYGVTMVQLRAEHQFSRREWYESALQLKQVLINTPVPLIIDDMVDIALAAEADGVHVGQKDLPASVVRQLVGPHKLVGLSVSNQQEMTNVPWSDIDYLGMGPVFPTTSKHNAPPDLGITQLAQLGQLRKKPAVAIGGLNQHNLAAVIGTGIDGIALVSAICGQPDIAKATRILSEKIVEAQR